MHYNVMLLFLSSYYTIEFSLYCEYLCGLVEEELEFCE